MTKKTGHYDFNLLRALEVFLAVAEYGQMTRAASALGITQSAVSQHLTNLESTYNSELIDRSLRPLGLTLTGLALQQHANLILQKVDAVTNDLHQLQHQHIPMLRIGILASLATILTPILIDEARGRLQIPYVRLYADLATAHQRLLQSRQVDMIVTSRALYDIDGLTRQPVLEETFLLVLPPNHKKINDLKELGEALPLVRFSANTPVGMKIDQHLRRANLEFERVIEADRTTMLMAAVAAGQGFTILSPTLLLDGIIEGMQITIQALPLQPLTRSIFLVSRSGELSNLPEVFKQSISQALQQAVAQKLNQICRDAVTYI